MYIFIFSSLAVLFIISLFRLNPKLLNRKITNYVEFIYEDGNRYYFLITDRYSSSYHSISVYKKIKYLKLFNFYKKIGKSELITTTFKSSDIKNECISILSKTLIRLDDWDGFIGNIPDDVKKSSLRENKLNNLLNK